MHIGIDASRLGTAQRTGTEQYTYELLGAMAQIDRTTRYTLYTNGLPPTLPPLGTNVALRSLPFPRLWTHLRLSWEMRWHSPDVLFVPAHVIPLHHPARSVVTLHDTGYLAYPETHTRLRRIELHLSTLWNSRAASQLITGSHAAKHDLRQHYHIPADAIQVIHHGISPRFQPVTADAITLVQQNYGIPPRYMLYLGTIQPRKNLVRVLDAFAMLVRGETGVLLTEPIHLVIAGKKGWRTEAIAARANEHAIQESLIFPGYIADEDVPALLSGAVAFVFPSLYEGFGLPVLEAMACNTPVITSTTSSLPEVAGDAALLVDPHDTHAIAMAMARLADDVSLGEELRQRGRVHAAHWTWERSARETVALLNAL